MILTRRSVILVGCGALATILTRTSMVVWVWALLVCAIAFVDWLLLPRQFVVKRDSLSPVRLGQTVTHSLTIENHSSRTIRGMLRDAWQPSAGAVKNFHPITLPSRERRTVTTVLQPYRRGHLSAHFVVVRTRSVLGLAWRQVTLQAPATLRVLPEFRSRRHLPSRLARLRELDGQTSLLVRGEGTEFDSLRDYVDGDDVRSLDWRASARRQQLVVRTWRPERDRRVIIVLDTSRVAAARLEQETRLDAGIETALFMSALANQSGDRVDVVAFDQQVKARVADTQGSSTMGVLADTLGPLAPELIDADWPMITQEVSSMVTGKALIVLCTAVDSGASGGLVEASAALSRHHQVIIASATDPQEADLLRRRDGTEEIFIAAATAQTQNDRRLLAQQLNAHGTHVIESHPDDLAPKVADRYLDLKATGKL